MKYFDKTFFKFFLGFLIFIAIGLIFVSKVQAALVNINTASLEELDTLPGVGPATAQSIINERPYASIQEISRADGISEPGSPSYENIINLITIGEPNPSPNTSTNSSVQSTPDSSSSSAVEFKTLKLITEGDKMGVVGQPMEFRAETNSEKMSVTWVLGDGSTLYGRNIQHVYRYPGEYVVVAGVSNSGKRVSARLNVRIVPDALSITQASAERVEIVNTGKDEINLFGRSLVYQEQIFGFPEDTIIKAGQRISFSSTVTRLKPNSKSEVALAILGEDGQVKMVESRTTPALVITPVKDLSNVATPAVALAINASANTDTATVEKRSWFKTVKKFFGFKN